MEVITMLDFFPQVKVFDYPHAYLNWVEGMSAYTFEIVDVSAFGGKLIVTYNMYK
jgi:hypothetical protein